MLNRRDLGPHLGSQARAGVACQSGVPHVTNFKGLSFKGGPSDGQYYIDKRY